ncbi:MAG: YidC/Oxa1 family membrane protein insertase [Oscillospiraceae bacterium]
MNMFSMFGFIAVPLGYIMDWIYMVVQNYGVTLIIFTIVTKLAMFPLSIKQQKSTAKMSAYQPMMQEIQKKWANDKQRQNEELMKFQQEYNISMSGGCLPMLVTMVVMFGLIEVIYSPLVYLFHIGKDVVAQAITLGGITNTSIAAQSELMNMIALNNEKFIPLLGADKVAAISNFNFNFFGIDLSQIPQLGFNLTIIIPILSIVTMIAMQLATTKMSGQQMTGMMKYLPWIMSLMFVTYGFQVPGGFSLYYTASNILSFIQAVLLKKMYDPDVMKVQFAEEVERKKAEKKKKKQVVVKTADGEEQVKDVTEAELARMRLARAREMDAQRYDD